MKIEIRKQTENGMKTVMMITFHTNQERFESDYEKTKFFRELHGWKQTVPRNGKKYVYQRSGLLDEVPHAKIADSVFIAALEHMNRIESFFREWEDKVDCQMHEIMMANKQLKDMMRRI